MQIIFFIYNLYLWLLWVTEVVWHSTPQLQPRKVVEGGGFTHCPIIWQALHKHTDTRGVHFITPEKSNKNLTLLQHVSHLNTSYNSDCNYHFVICQSDNRLCCLQITKNIAPTQPIQKSNKAKTENDAHATTTNIWEESVLTIYHLSVSDTGQVWHHLCFVADVM